MNRREFTKFLALMGAGLSAQPQQIKAFERYYEVNTPQVETDLIAIDEIYIGGEADHSVVAPMKLLKEGEPILNLSMNLFGGIVRWVAAGDMKIMGRKKDFKLACIGVSTDDYCGHISYLDQDGLRHYWVIGKDAYDADRS